ncbi:MAG: DUF5662 family protein [Vulcanibacillus sp.]
MIKGSSKESTLKHKRTITNLMNKVIIELLNRSMEHDNTKLEDPELALFDEYTPKLATTTYGSEKYNQFLKELQPALDHHYKMYRHHPEHHTNGCRDMNLIDIVEMFVDWKAASMRHNDGDILKSINLNALRFKLDEVSLYDILMNSIKLFEGENNV